MFEPKTYHERLLGLHLNAFKQFIAGLPSEILDGYLPAYQQALAAEQMIKVSHAETVLGACTIEADQRAQLAWVSALMSVNMGRTFFGNLLKGAQFDGAIGTKSFGKKWKTWLSELPDLDESLAADMETGFYIDTSRGFPLPYFVAVTNSQIVLYCVGRGGAMVGQQLYLNHLPEVFNWMGARHEIFPYRADATRAQVAIELAKAVIAQGVTTLVIPQESSEEVLAALRAGSYDTTLNIMVFDGEKPVEPLDQAEVIALRTADQEEEIAELNALKVAARKAAADEFAAVADQYDHYRLSCITWQQPEHPSVSVVLRSAQESQAYRLRGESETNVVPVGEIVAGQFVELDTWEVPDGVAGFYEVTAIELVQGKPPVVSQDQERVAVVECQGPAGPFAVTRRGADIPESIEDSELGDAAKIQYVQVTAEESPTGEAGEFPLVSFFYLENASAE